MFVYEPDAGVPATTVRDAAQRVSRRLIARLEDRSGGQRLYEVDMRLRPSGRQGLLVSSLTGFRNYHERPLEIWERLALVRLRAVAELRFDATATHPTNEQPCTHAVPGSLSRMIAEDIVPRSVWAAETPQRIAHETRRLKQRIETELARETREQWNVKTGVGGCLELELLVSALQLQHGVRVREIPTALERLAALGVLDAADATALDRAYRFQRRLLNRLRMSRTAGRGEADRLSLNSPRLTALARRMGLADRDALLSILERERGIIRAAFDRCLDADSLDDDFLDDTHAGDH
jgi:glutamate-ammonia-ligase adenylyltransferase